MKLNQELLEPILKGMGFTATTPKTYVMTYEERRYLVDFKTDQVCRTDGQYFDKRVVDDNEDEFLCSLIRTIMEATGDVEEDNEVLPPEDETPLPPACNQEEDFTTEQKLKIVELKNDYGYDTKTAIKVMNGCKTVAARQNKPRKIPIGYVPKLSIDDGKMYLCPKATDQEAHVFLELCQARNLNPFTNEVYLVKYKDSVPAQTIVGKETFTRRAELNPMFDGFEAGIIVMNAAGTIERREGTFYIPDEEQIVGGWAKVYRKDRSRPFVSEVALHEYIQYTKEGEITSFWKKTGTLIRKVPLVQALRKAFPGEFGGLYDRSELDTGEEA